MIHKILEAYDLHAEDFEIMSFGNGLINTTWRLKNKEKDLILQKINHAIFKKPYDIAHNIASLAKYLELHVPEYLFTRPLLTKQNSGLLEIDNSFYRLTNYVPGSRTIDTVEKPEQAFEAARQFGKFTKLLSAYPVETLKITLPDFHNLTLRYAQFEESIKTGNKERIKESRHLIDAMIQHKNIAGTYDMLSKNPAFKKRVTHHDTKISNVLLDANDRGLCVIDLDTVMPGYFISDVGDMIRTYLSPANEEEQDLEKIAIREIYFKAIWDGYMSEMNSELTNTEALHFIYAGKFLIYMQAIRFLADYLNNDTYYGARYDKHNFVRASNQLRLLEILIQKEQRLKVISR